jgi:hypothetical protein
MEAGTALTKIFEGAVRSGGAAGGFRTAYKL